MILKALIGMACVAVIAVAATWFDDRFGIIAMMTAPEARTLSDEEFARCARIENDRQSFAADYRYVERAARLQAQLEAECR